MKKKLLTFVSLFGLLCIPLPTIAQEQDCKTPETSEAKIDLSFVTYPQGISSRKAMFSVNSNGDKVLFSRGNLQFYNYANNANYQRVCKDGSTKDGLFRFAAEQYDFIGENNSYINQNGYWVDLFTYGSSGNTINASIYSGGCCGTNNGYSLIGDHKYDDWGPYNAVIIEPATGNIKKSDVTLTTGYDEWRTLTSDEWTWILSGRPNASDKKGSGRIELASPHQKYGAYNCNYVYGWILLPDEWTCPAGLSFNSSYSGIDFSNNSYTPSQWEVMEAAGAVFLPLTSHRSSYTVSGGGQEGRYWTTTWVKTDGWGAENTPRYIQLRYDGIGVNGYSTNYNGNYGNAVRLVHDY